MPGRQFSDTYRPKGRGRTKPKKIPDRILAAQAKELERMLYGDNTNGVPPQTLTATEKIKAIAEIAKIARILDSRSREKSKEEKKRSNIFAS